MTSIRIYLNYILILIKKRKNAIHPITQKGSGHELFEYFEGYFLLRVV